MFPEKEFVRRFHPREIVALGGILKERGYPGRMIEVIQVGEWVITVNEIDEGRFYPVVCDLGGREVGLEEPETIKFSTFGEWSQQLKAYAIDGRRIIKSCGPDGLVNWSVTVHTPPEKGIHLIRELEDKGGQGRVAYRWTQSTPPEIIAEWRAQEKSLYAIYGSRGGKAFLLNKSLPGGNSLPWWILEGWDVDALMGNLFDPRCRSFKKYPFWVEKHGVFNVVLISP